MLYILHCVPVGLVLTCQLHIFVDVNIFLYINIKKQCCMYIYNFIKHDVTTALMVITIFELF